ncbi:MAG: SpoIIIAH-like family protein [Lachnospiraceae bacterium]|jgi:stage III sporulation protein AH|nr:SpoIIIAH-like family protein [Lachnospiraceae bacterium]NBJ83108.1 SpoIIIAH-like family protein [bacterium 1XD42-76]NBK06399.1 SpoIIIAH-like family protein [bacterium 1XD42-94]
MKRIFRRNQVIITTLAVMIAAAGYLNYSAKKEVAGAEVYEAGMMEISDEDILAENRALNGVDDGSLKEIASLDGDGEETLLPESGSMTGSAETGNAGQETAAAGMENPGEAVLTNGTSVSEYIAGVQLNREQIRAKNKETLMELINNEQITEVEKQAAIQGMIELTEVVEKENAAETLLKAKGFVDPVVSITSGKVDVVINAVSLTDPERAQIEDIVKRKTEIGADGIVITLLDLAE